MILDVYIDTSVFGALADPGEERRALTAAFLEQLAAGQARGYVSEVVLDEVARAPERVRATLEEAISRCCVEVLALDGEAKALADEYMRAGVVSARYQDDALHVAVASVHHLDAVVSWNFRHMVNLSRKRIVQAVNLRLGYRLIDIVSPQEVLP